MTAADNFIQSLGKMRVDAQHLENFVEVSLSFPHPLFLEIIKNAGGSVVKKGALLGDTASEQTILAANLKGDAQTLTNFETVVAIPPSWQLTCEVEELRDICSWIAFEDMNYTPLFIVPDKWPVLFYNIHFEGMMLCCAALLESTRSGPSVNSPDYIQNVLSRFDIEKKEK